jgi:hypothetical protein
MADEEQGDAGMPACRVLVDGPEVFEIVGEGVHVAPQASAPAVAAQVEGVAGKGLVQAEAEHVSVAPRVLPEAVDQDQHGPGRSWRRGAPQP